MNKITKTQQIGAMLAKYYSFLLHPHNNESFKLVNQIMHHLGLTLSNIYAFYARNQCTDHGIEAQVKRLILFF